MGINLNDNIRISAGKPLDSKYLNADNVPYTGVTEVNTTIAIGERHIGLTVNVDGVNYWYKDSVADVGLVEKIYNTIIPTGEFITGGSNVGYFSGFTGIKTLPINDLNDNTYDGNYSSLYNNYYVDVNNLLNIGIPTDGIPKRGFVKTVDNVKSWVWNESIDGNQLLGWTLVDGNIGDLVGTTVSFASPQYYNGATTFPYTGATFDTGESYNNGSKLIIDTVMGSLTTGNTLTVGGRPFQNIEDNTLKFRTIKSDTPEVISIYDDDVNIHVSGKTNIYTNVNASSSGFGIFSGTTGTVSTFKRIQGAGDTAISEVDGTLMIFTSGGGRPNESVRAATIEDIVLSGLLTIDTYELQENDRVLVKNQDDAVFNGVYNASGGAWTRSDDFSGEVLSGAYMYVTSGSTNKDFTYMLTTPDPVEVGVSELTFNIYNRNQTIAAGVGMDITLSGGTNVISINTPTMAIINSSVTGATNGLTKYGDNIGLGGTLTGDTVIDGAYTLGFNNTIINITGSTSVNLGGVVKLFTTPATGTTSDNILVWNSTDKIIKKVTVDSIGTACYDIIGDDNTTGFTINHALNNQYPIVQIACAASPYDTIITRVDRTDVNNVLVYFDDAPLIGEDYKVMII